MKPRFVLAAAAKVSQDRARITARITMLPTFVIPMGTSSKLCAMHITSDTFPNASADIRGGRSNLQDGLRADLWRRVNDRDDKVGPASFGLCCKFLSVV